MIRRGSLCGATAVAVLALALAACGSGPVRSAESGRLRGELTALQTDPQFAGRVPPLALREAERAVTAAEQPQSNAALATHLDYLADRKLKTARALAESRSAEDRLHALDAPSPPPPPAPEAPAALSPEPAPSAAPN